jgi:hypothetical protein
LGIAGRWTMGQRDKRDNANNRDDHRAPAKECPPLPGSSAPLGQLHPARISSIERSIVSSVGSSAFESNA